MNGLINVRITLAHLIFVTIFTSSRVRGAVRFTRNPPLFLLRSIAVATRVSPNED